MPGRSSQPWYRKSKSAWYVWIGGRLRALGKDRKAAFRRYHLLMAGVEPAQNQDSVPRVGRLTVQQLVEHYLVDAERRLARNTFRVAKAFANSFVNAHGTLHAEDVRKQHVEEWIGRHTTWGPMTEWDAKTRLMTLFRWGVDQEMLIKNPIHGLKKPPIRSRGALALVPPEIHSRLMDAARPALRDVLLALYLTGARPGEVVVVTAREFIPEAAVWILTRHKTAHEGKSRVIHLTAEMIVLCQDLAAKYPQGPLFRTATGRPWCHTCYLAEQLRQLRTRLCLPDTITPYSYRHTFATDALANGVPDAQVAELLGHQGTAMLHRHYAHLTARARVMRNALDRVRPAEKLKSGRSELLKLNR